MEGPYKNVSLYFQKSFTALNSVDLKADFKMNLLSFLYQCSGPWRLLVSLTHITEH